MTVDVGFPDWQRPHSQTTETIFNDSFRIYNNNESTQFLPCGNFQAIIINYTPNVASRLTIEFWNDNVGVLQLGTRSFDLKANQGLSRAVPVMGQFVKFTVQFGVANAQVFAFWAVATAAPLSLNPVANNTPLVSVSQNVAAASNVFVDAAYSYTGPAVFYAASTAAAWVVFVEAWDYLGGNMFVAAHKNTLGNGGVVTISLPARQIRVHMFNQDAAVKLFEVALTPLT